MANQGAVAGRLVVGVATFHRAGPLAALLPLLLAELDGVADVLDPPSELGLVVVDNDPSGSAEPVVSRVMDARVTYARETTPGISAARNRILDLAAGADLLVFIDDDETPEPGWLRALIETWRSSGADAVSGPVVSVPDGALDPWVAAGGFFERSHRDMVPTGAALDRAATNNLLLHLPAVRRLSLRFDPRFGLSGGEDSLFTRSLVARGGRIVWCAEAVVLDRLPVDRLTRSYALSRTYGLAHSSTRVDLALQRGAAGRARGRMRAVVTGVARLAWGAAQGARGVLARGVEDRARGRRMMARGRGEIAAALGTVRRSYGGSGG
ncbi:glycosyltransferase family 2 protein [Aeromicrobium senzhongii]|uniref:Glycosyltransferase family 2 protein n=1 Tax=Aeromicrobium senzhongii TaxID=2663859 RepID=A0ABX6SUA9_9ACTN|nr:glycosyltransferase [Aeromicrobium senzhongii]QNL94994.1 glycosyltransferase family 2 protein [Aeromicrobium senzhongii]